jgi:hypothetical protein
VLLIGSCSVQAHRNPRAAEQGNEGIRETASAFGAAMVGRRARSVIGSVLRRPCLSLLSSRGEDGHGSLRWAGRSSDELHAGGDGTVGEAVEVDGGGDERSGVGGGGEEHSRPRPFMPGGGDSERMAARAALAARGGAGGGGGAAEQGGEGRSARRLGASGGASDGIGTDAWGALRTAVRGYGFAVRDVVRAMNRLRSVFLSRGVAVNDGVYNAKGRVRWLGKLTPPHRRLAEWLGGQLDQLVPLREQAEEWLLEEAKTHPIIRKLATAPGMGPIRTAQVVAITANPHRFRTRRQYWSYCGFGIVARSSSDWVQGKDGRWERSQVQQTRGLTRKRHPLLKSVFKGAATTVIAQLPEHPLHKDYERMLAAGIKPNLAKLTVARKIAATVLSMWKHQEVYDPQRHRAVNDKA